MQPGPAPLDKPTPPDFKLRKLMKVAYGMSVTTGGLGQVLFLGDKFGGTAPAYAAALFLAAFVEFCMVSSGDSSLHHRCDGEAWKLMLALSLGFAGYAAANQLLHFWHTDLALAVMFAGASVAGFLLHILDGHIRAAAYLRVLAKWQAAQETTPEATAPPQRPARQAPRPATKPIVKTGESKLAAEAAPVVAEADTRVLPVIENVRPISSAKGLSQREQAYQWFAEQVRERGGNPTAVDGPAIAKQFGAQHWAKKISEFRQRWRTENPAAVNE